MRRRPRSDCARMPPRSPLPPPRMMPSDSAKNVWRTQTPIRCCLQARRRLLSRCCRRVSPSRHRAGRPRMRHKRRQLCQSANNAPSLLRVDSANAGSPRRVQATCAQRTAAQSFVRPPPVSIVHGERARSSWATHSSRSPWRHASGFWSRCKDERGWSSRGIQIRIWSSSLQRLGRKAEARARARRVALKTACAKARTALTATEGVVPTGTLQALYTWLAGRSHLPERCIGLRQRHRPRRSPATGVGEAAHPTLSLCTTCVQRSATNALTRLGRFYKSAQAQLHGCCTSTLAATTAVTFLKRQQQLATPRTSRGWASTFNSTLPRGSLRTRRMLPRAPFCAATAISSKCSPACSTVSRLVGCRSAPSPSCDQHRGRRRGMPSVGCSPARFSHCCTHGWPRVAACSWHVRIPLPMDTSVLSWSSRVDHGVVHHLRPPFHRQLRMQSRQTACACCASIGLSGTATAHAK